jgi:hypothetical protein
VYDFDEQQTIIESAVERLLGAAGISQPPVQPARIARAMRINVLDRELPLRRGQSYLYRGMKFVDLARAGRPERRNFALAHEIMELELAGVVPDKEQKHTIALRGAAALLCPAVFFREACTNGSFDLFQLKAVFSTASHEVIALRSLDFAEAIVSVFDNGRLVNRQTSYPFGVQPVAQEEQALVDRVMRSGQVEAHAWEGASATAYPVFEAQFRRIILRTSLDQACL